MVFCAISFLNLAIIAASIIGLVQGCQPRDYGYGGTVCVCNHVYCDTIEPLELPEYGKFTMYTSNLDGLRFYKSVSSYDDFEEDPSGVKIQIVPDKTYQEIFGFGGAFTDATGINIKSLPISVRQSLLSSYFSPQGIEYSLCRIPIGGTDFSTHGYSYDDVENDDNLDHFSLAPEDFKYKLPMIHEAQKLSGGTLKFFGSSWTIPKWLKTNGQYTGFGATIKPEKYQVLANYFLKFLEAYKENGVDIWGITTQNEPSLAWIPIPPFNRINSVGWTPHQLSVYIGKHLGPTLRNSQHSNTKIMCLDDQRSFLPWFADWLFGYEEARQYIDGIAVHWYFNSITPAWVLNTTHQRHPDKFILATEASQGEFSFTKVQLGSWSRGEDYVKDIMENMENWVSGWTDWNMALDVTGGPTYINNNLDSPIIVNKTAGEFYKQPMYYAMGHFSKFVPPGSRRIFTSQSGKYVRNVGFVRPDGAVTLVIFNGQKFDVPVSIQHNKNGILNLVATKRSINTIIFW